MPQQTFVNGQVLTGPEMMLVPQGVIALAQNTSQAAITSTVSPGTAIAGWSLTVTVAAFRTLRLKADFQAYFPGSPGVASIVITEGATILGGSALSGGGAGWEASVIVETYITPSAGTHTYAVSCYVDSNSVVPNTDHWFTIEDC